MATTHDLRAGLDQETIAFSVNGHGVSVCTRPMQRLSRVPLIVSSDFERSYLVGVMAEVDLFDGLR